MSLPLMLRAMLASAAALALVSPVLVGGASGDEIWLGGQSMKSNTFQFSFTASAGHRYPIEMSVDLLQWGELTNVLAGEGPLWVTDPEAGKFRQRFYRVALPAVPVSNMVYIQPGTFTMGSPESEVGRSSDEGPQTEVTITRGFWMGKYEVTGAEYIAVVGTNDYSFGDARLPANLVTWFMASNYCYKLTERERAAGRLPSVYLYRLPTEAEWEYASRTGKSTPFGIGDGTSLSSTQANFDGNFPYGGAAPGPYYGVTMDVGSYAPNAWGLYNMHGNVWEWCQDWYGAYPGGKAVDPKGPATGSGRVVRGGGYTSPGQSCRSANRDSRSPGYREAWNGFRVVLALA